MLCRTQRPTVGRKHMTAGLRQAPRALQRCPIRVSAQGADRSPLHPLRSSETSGRSQRRASPPTAPPRPIRLRYWRGIRLLGSLASRSRLVSSPPKHVSSPMTTWQQRGLKRGQNSLCENRLNVGYARAGPERGRRGCRRGADRTGAARARHAFRRASAARGSRASCRRRYRQAAPSE